MVVQENMSSLLSSYLLLNKSTICGYGMKYIYIYIYIYRSHFAVNDNGLVGYKLFSYFSLSISWKCSATLSSVLLLDSYSKYFEPKSLQVAKDNDIVIFCLSPHTTHVCQSLDCSLFKSLKQPWREECYTFHQKNPGFLISKCDCLCENRP